MKTEVTREVIYNYQPGFVWETLTHEWWLSGWLLPCHESPADSLELRLGHRFHFLRPVPGSPAVGGRAVGRPGSEVIECEVIDFQPPSRLAFTWREPADRVPAVVTWTLEPGGRGTRLRLAFTRKDKAAAVHPADAAAATRFWDEALAELGRFLDSNERHGR